MKRSPGKQKSRSRERSYPPDGQNLESSVYMNSRPGLRLLRDGERVQRIQNTGCQCKVKLMSSTPQTQQFLSDKRREKPAAVFSEMHTVTVTAHCRENRARTTTPTSIHKGLGSCWHVHVEGQCPAVKMNEE